MSTSSKGRKAKVVAFTAMTFISGGFTIGKQDAATAKVNADMLATLKVLAKTDVVKARDAFKTGYIAGRLHDDAKVLTKEMRLEAESVLKGVGLKADKQASKGQIKRNDKQEAAYLASNSAWSRLSAAMNFDRADKRGAKRGVTRGKAKVAKGAETTASVKPAVITKTADLTKAIHTFKGQWAALMVASKPLTLPAEVSDIAVKITVLVNELEIAMGKIGK